MNQTLQLALKAMLQGGVGMEKAIAIIRAAQFIHGMRQDNGLWKAIDKAVGTTTCDLWRTFSVPEE